MSYTREFNALLSGNPKSGPESRVEQSDKSDVNSVKERSKEAYEVFLRSFNMSPDAEYSANGRFNRIHAHIGSR